MGLSTGKPGDAPAHPPEDSGVYTDKLFGVHDAQMHVTRRGSINRLQQLVQRELQ